MSKLALKAADASPEKVAVKDQDRSFTYQEFKSRTLALSHYLNKCGIAKGDRVAVLMKNRLEHIELDVALAHGGIIKVPLNYRLHPKELDYQVRDAGVSLVIGDPELLESLSDDFPLLPVGAPYEQAVTDHMGAAFLEEVDEDDLFAIMYTSGTTGNPKGVMLSHRNMIAGALSLAQVCEVSYDDVVGHVAPLTHGSNFLSHVSWLYGLTQVVYDRFEAEHFLDRLAADRVSIIFMVPTIVNLMIQDASFDAEKLRHVKSINMAGSPIAVAKLQDALDKAGTIFVETYGQVEAPMCITVMPRTELSKRLDSCGRIGPFVDMKIIDDDGNEVMNGEVGEIMCKGSLVMRGYWNNETATQETLKDGWLHTGDLGWRDNLGYLYLVDRKKDVIISGGVNIYPREVEEVLNKHEGVKETCVIGVEDEKWGENVIAYVVPNGRSEVEEEDLLGLCKEHLASFKKPKEIHIVDALPKSSYGKMLKRELKTLHAGVKT